MKPYYFNNTGVLSDWCMGFWHLKFAKDQDLTPWILAAVSNCFKMMCISDKVRKINQVIVKMTHEIQKIVESLIIIIIDLYMSLPWILWHIKHNIALTSRLTDFSYTLKFKFFIKFTIVQISSFQRHSSLPLILLWVETRVQKTYLSDLLTTYHFTCESRYSNLGYIGEMPKVNHFSSRATNSVL